MIHQLDKIKIVEALECATNGAGLTGKWISLKNILKVLIIVQVTQATAATVALTIEMSKLVAGTNNTAITEVIPIWSNLDTAASDVLVKRTRAVNYTTDDGVKNKVVIFELDADRLDAEYDCINVNAGSSSGSDMVSAIYLCELRYSGADTDSD